jgi:hypothetical protein
MKLGIAIGLIYAFLGMRLLMFIDDSGCNDIMRWAGNSEGRTWLALFAWPLVLILTLLIWISGQALRRRVRRQRRFNP